MASKYEFIRPAKAIPTRKRKNISLRFFLFLLLLIAVSYFCFIYFYKNPHDKEISVNRKLANYSISCFDIANTLITISYKGPEAKNNVKYALQKVKQLKSSFFSSGIIHRASKPEQREAALLVLEALTSLEDALTAPIEPTVYKSLIPKIKQRLEILRFSVLKLEIPKDLQIKLKNIELKFDSSKVFKVNTKKEILGKRRGFGIISFSLKPRYESKTPEGYLILPKTELVDITIEVQNQGEVEESDISIMLTLKTTGDTEPLTFSESIESLKPFEKKPVTFMSIPLNEPAGTLYTASLTVKPVEGEKVISNNILEISFLVAN